MTTPISARPKNQPTTPRKRTRPARIRDLEVAARQLAGEYEAWLAALPDNLAAGEMADQLAEAIEQLTDIADSLGAMDPPRIRRQV